MEIRYYQWVPIMLSVQALLFMCPKLLWKASYFASGVNLPRLVSVLNSFDITFEQKRWSRTLQYTAVHIDKFCLRFFNYTVFDQKC